MKKLRLEGKEIEAETGGERDEEVETGGERD